MKNFRCFLSSILVIVMLLSSSVNITANADEAEAVEGETVATAERIEDEVIDTETAEAPSVVTERGMQFRIENLEDVKSIRYAYGEYETEKDIKYGVDSVSHSAKTLRTRGDSCTLQFPKPGLVSIVITYNDGTRDFHKYDVIKNSPTVTRDGGNSITFSDLSDLKVLRYVKGEYESSYDIKRATGSVAISGKTLTSDTYTVELERETYTFCVQYNDESYNYYVTGVCGDNLTWVYDMQSATLTVSGEGEMGGYNYRTIPWVKYKTKIKNVILNEGITSLSDGSFCDCGLLETINLSLTLIKIGGEAFYDCDALKSVIIPDSVTYIETCAFSKCDNLESIVIGNGLTSINPYTFADCPKLKNVVFGNKINSIGYCAFVSCISLNDINLPDSLEQLEEFVFSDTGYSNNEENWENKLLYLDGHLIGASTQIGTCIIKNGTKSIANYVFEDSYLDVVYIPETLKHIPYSGFYNSGSNKLYYYVVKGSYGEEFVKKYNCSYSYFDPAEIYGQ